MKRLFAFLDRFGREKKNERKIKIEKRSRQEKIKINPRSDSTKKSPSKPKINLWLVIATLFIALVFMFIGLRPSNSGDSIHQQINFATSLTSIERSDEDEYIIDSLLLKNTQITDLDIPTIIKKQLADLYELIGLRETEEVFKIVFLYTTINLSTETENRLLASQFFTTEETFEAFYCEQLNTYLNGDGMKFQQRFLLAPVANPVISSKFNPFRKNPITGEIIPHGGTDYADKEGTEILSVGDGIVDTIGHNSRNGYYVKIKHDKVYTSQYLHLTKKPVAGIVRGAPVKKGQLIGYMGCTGLCTGNHVCFRFGKNGKEIDHYEEISTMREQPIVSPTNSFFDQVKSLSERLVLSKNH